MLESRLPDKDWCTCLRAPGKVSADMQKIYEGFVALCTEQRTQDAPAHNLAYESFIGEVRHRASY
jgi:hypothetical protein